MTTPSLALCGASLPASSPKELETLAVVQDVLLRAEQTAIRTEHILHGGMYSRTVRIVPQSYAVDDQLIICGSRLNLPTMLIINGPIDTWTGGGWKQLDGFNVLTGSAGRKQLFLTRGAPVEMTMIYPTKARTVEDAENEVFAEPDMLLSRQSQNDTTLITGEWR